MTLDNVIQQITEGYSPLSALARAEVRDCAHLMQVPKRTILVNEGEYADTLYYVVKGSVRAYYLKDGRDVTDWFAFEDDFISAIISFFLERPSEHYIEVLEDSMLMTLGRDDIQRLCDRHHDFERLGRISVTKTLLALQQRVVSIQFQTAYERYQYLLKRFPLIEQRAPLGHIASFLGISQETLSRLRAS